MLAEDDIISATNRNDQKARTRISSRFENPTRCDFEMRFIAALVMPWKTINSDGM